MICIYGSFNSNWPLSDNPEYIFMNGLGWLCLSLVFMFGMMISSSNGKFGNFGYGFFWSVGFVALFLNNTYGDVYHDLSHSIEGTCRGVIWSTADALVIVCVIWMVLFIFQFMYEKHRGQLGIEADRFAAA